MTFSSISPLPQVCAVVVTYQPPATVMENVTRLLEQFSLVVVVDNGSNTESAAVLSSLEREKRCHLIRNAKNLGIASALNQGLRLAIAEGFGWVATFDQDSTITPGFVQGLLHAYDSCPFRDRVALIAPGVTYPESNPKNSSATTAPDFELIRVALTSGSLFRTGVLTTVGYYDESLFIDYVDYDFCLRLQKAGYALIRANRAVLQHRLGTAETHSLLGRTFTLKSHSAWRRYFITRNRVILYRRYCFSFPAWCLHDLMWFFAELAKIILFEQAKAAKLASVAKGLIHGLIGKTGPLGQAPA